MLRVARTVARGRRGWRRQSRGEECKARFGGVRHAKIVADLGGAGKRNTSESASSLKAFGSLEWFFTPLCCVKGIQTEICENQNTKA